MTRCRDNALRPGLARLGAAAAMMALWIATGTAAAAADCPEAPEPVTSLSFESRYAADSATRSALDAEAADAAEEALRPVEDFIRDLATDASAAADAQSAEDAACVIGRMATWAEADALQDLGTGTASLTVGSRLAGFALIHLQMVPLTNDPDAAAEVGLWLDRRIAEQISFWETDAPDGARQGNLRAWAALAAAARAADPTAKDPMRFAFWAGASASYVLCTAAPDGSLPQEMRRGPRALQYQLHAVAPLSVISLLLQRIGMPVAPICDNALDRAAGFALTDIETGEATRAITGETQTFFDGKDAIEEFHLAWVAAYLGLDGITHGDLARSRVQGFGDLNYSKLGGNQTRMWQPPK